MKGYLKVFLMVSVVLFSIALFSQEKTADFKEDVDKLKNDTTAEIDQIKEKAKTDIEKAKPEIKKTSEVADNKKTELLDQDNEPIKTVMGSKRFIPGGYMAPVIKLSQIGMTGNDIGYFFGLRTGFIMNHNFSLGLAANVLFNPLDRARLGAYNYSGLDSVVNMAYGGVLLEYYIFPKSIVNISVGVLVGGGAMVFQDGNYWKNQTFNPQTLNGFFTVEPEINVFLNVTRFFRIGVGATYRYITGMVDPNITDAAFRGFGGQFMLQLGWF
jgi:hypothetical protein